MSWSWAFVTCYVALLLLRCVLVELVVSLFMFSVWFCRVSVSVNLSEIRPYRPDTSHYQTQPRPLLRWRIQLN